MSGPERNKRLVLDRPGDGAYLTRLMANAPPAVLPLLQAADAAR